MKLKGYSSDYAYGDLQRLIEHIKINRKNRKGICCYCETALNGKNYTRDHLYPKSLGGRETKPCCKTCNTEKANLTLPQYMQYIGLQMYKMEKKGERDTLHFRQCQTKMKNIEYLMTLKSDQK